MEYAIYHVLNIVATSLSLDMTALFDNAFPIVNALWPVAAVIVGLALGFTILGFLIVKFTHLKLG
jgi:hypothetical protein